MDNQIQKIPQPLVFPPRVEVIPFSCFFDFCQVIETASNVWLTLPKRVLKDSFALIPLGSAADFLCGYPFVLSALGDVIQDGLKQEKPRAFDCAGITECAGLNLAFAAYPNDLPSLITEKKPKDNKRLNGIREFHHQRKTRGELPEDY